jgi:hypothetical protein
MTALCPDESQEIDRAKAVIPTKVGIQRLTNWIPTFVGMTIAGIDVQTS